MEDPFAELETARLLLSPPRVADIPAIVELANNPNIAKNVFHLPYPYREKDAVFWINMAYQGLKEESRFIFALRLKPDDDFIGGMGLTLAKAHHRAEMGYWVGEPYWNKGYASEAAAAVLQFGFEQLKLNKINATHLDTNPASGKVMTKNGMIREGVLKEHMWKDGAFKTLVQYAMLRNDFQRHSKKNLL